MSNSMWGVMVKKHLRAKQMMAEEEKTRMPRPEVEEIARIADVLPDDPLDRLIAERARRQP